MPNIEITYEEANLPAELKPYFKDGKVSMWVGDNVAGETNPVLAKEVETLKSDKATLENTNANYLQTNSDLSIELQKKNTEIGKLSSGKPVDRYESVLKDLGEPNDIKQKLDNYEKVQPRLKQLSLNEKAEGICEAEGWEASKRNIKVVADRLIATDGADYVIETETVDDKPVNKVFVNTKGENNEDIKTPLKSFINTNEDWTPYTPLLAENTDATGQTLPKQKPSGKGGNKNADSKPWSTFTDKHNSKAKVKKEE